MVISIGIIGYRNHAQHLITIVGTDSRCKLEYIFHFDAKKKLWSTKFNPEDYKRPVKLKADLIDSSSNKKVLQKHKKRPMTLQDPKMKKLHILRLP